MFTEVLICHLILSAKLKHLVFLVCLESCRPFDKINGNIHFRVNLILSLLFDVLHLFGMLTLLFVEPGVVSQLKPVTLSIENSQTLSSIHIVFNETVSMI
jgi:hypothetical protein